MESVILRGQAFGRTKKNRNWRSTNTAPVIDLLIVDSESRPHCHQTAVIK